MATREFDVVVWGATGFTGKLVVEYLVNTYGVDGTLKWAIAGRNPDKLAQLVMNLGLGDETLPLIIADSTDGASLEAMVERASVICTTVGPYAKYGTPLVAACVKAGTHYCDLTGEVQWMARLIPEFESAARDSGARIVHTCGFDSVPFDMGVWAVQQLMHERHGVFARRVKGRVGGSRGGASGGTLASIFNMMEEMRDDPSLRERMEDPYSLYPPGTPPGDDGPDQRGMLWDEDFDQWTTPFIMAAINTRVVRRSNALLAFPWGTGFRYDESLLVRSRVGAMLATAANGAGMLGMALTPTRRLLQRVLPQPGEGPSEATRTNGYYEIFFHAVHPNERSRDARIKVRGDLDPGYGSTSRMLGEAAVCLALDPPLTGGGFWTPASALGATYLERLRDNAGVSFTPVE
ncbi:MAG: saccharopine dehydrogenase NADP-binding domain-containing protein [Pseudomonadota bacterium]